MPIQRSLVLSACGVGLLLLGGCAAPQPNAGFAVQRLPEIEGPSAFAAGAIVLQDNGWQIDHYDANAGVLTTAPILDVRGDEPSRRSLGISSRSHTRRYAELRVDDSDGLVTVYCRVLIQEQTTHTHRMVAGDRVGRDTPNDTPIEREAATTSRQNTVWQTIRRDKRAERQILAELSERLGITVPGSAP